MQDRAKEHRKKNYKADNIKCERSPKTCGQSNE